MVDLQKKALVACGEMEDMLAPVAREEFSRSAETRRNIVTWVRHYLEAAGFCEGDKIQLGLVDHTVSSRALGVQAVTVSILRERGKLVRAAESPTIEVVTPELLPDSRLGISLRPPLSHCDVITPLSHEGLRMGVIPEWQMNPALLGMRNVPAGEMVRAVKPAVFTMVLAQQPATNPVESSVEATRGVFVRRHFRRSMNHSEGFHV